MADVPTTDEGKRAWLREGKPLLFDPPPTAREETPEEKTARTVQAAWLEELAPRPERTVRVPIQIAHAIIEGPLDFQYTTFQCELALTNCEFREPANFTFAVFNRSAHLDGSSIPKAANFRAGHARADFVIAGATFGDGSSFQDLHVDELLQASGASFGEVNFERIDIGKNAFFRTDENGKRPQFGGEARFHGAHIHGSASFIGAEFKDKAAFDGIQVDGSAFFRADDKGNGVQFGGEVRFHGTHIQGPADFSGAEFKGRASFDRMQVEGSAFFRSDRHGNRAHFGAEARFHGAHIHGNAEFGGAEFKGSASFDDMHVDGMTFFRPDKEGNRVTFADSVAFPLAVFGSGVQFTRADFRRSAYFDNAHFQGAADFTSAEFSEKENTKATFIGARFERGAYFDSTQFKRDADFTSAVVERDARFAGARFSGAAIFREAHFRAAFFGEAAAPDDSGSGEGERASQLFSSTIDLRGFTYERIYVHLKSLLSKLSKSEYDRQPYTQLEKVLRETGKDREADDVYLERRRVERKLKFQRHQFGSWVGDGLYRIVAYYGVRPYRLLGATLAILLLGVFVFSRPGAVMQREKAERSNDAVDLTLWPAIGVSLHQFLPVEIPSASTWVPTEKPFLLVGPFTIAFTTYATFHRLAGWLLVPLGVAALTGMLHRRAKS